MKENNGNLFTFLAVAIIIIAGGIAIALLGPNEPDYDGFTLYEEMANRENLSQFVSLVDQAELNDELGTNGESNYTVFAVSNDALEKLADAGMSPDQIVNHILEDEVVYTNAMTQEDEFTTMGDTTIANTVNDKGELFIGKAMVSERDILANNGVMHVVDNVVEIEVEAEEETE